jgi:limonene-1,2-epoxide hydrolase
MPTSSPAVETTKTADPIEVVRTFLLALQDGDLDAALPMLAEDVRWINVSLPTVKGRSRVAWLLRLLFKRGLRFRVHLHAIATDGDVILTDRTDATGFGRFEPRFWVYGRFAVSDGQITLWRDSFDWVDVTLSVLRGVAAMLVPAVNRPWPGDA